MSGRSSVAYDVEEMRRRLADKPELVPLVSLVMGHPNGLTTTELARTLHGTEHALLDLTRERVAKQCQYLITLRIFDTLRIEQPTPRARDWTVRPAPMFRKVYRIHEEVLSELESSKPAQAQGR